MKLTKEEVGEIVENIHQSTFHMTDEEAKPIINEFIENFPDLLNHYTKEELYKM